VNCVLALKSYSDWKQGGGLGSWKLGGNLKPPTCGKPFLRKNSEPFMNSFSRTVSPSEKSLESLCSDLSSCSDLSHDLNEGVSEVCISVCFFFFFLHFLFVKVAWRLKSSMYSDLQGSSRCLNMLVREALSDRKQEEIPIVSVLAPSLL
jgi:hypothetical protein